jgi:hypothetical protein
MLAAVSTAAAIVRAPDPRAGPATRFTLAGRLAAVGTLVLGAGFQLAAFIAEPRHDETIDRFEWIADNPERADLAKLFDVLAMPFLFGTVIVYVLLSRERSRRLAYAAGILLGCGMVGLAIVQGYESFAFTAVQDGSFGLEALAHAFEETSPAAVAMLLLFLPGALFGLLAFTVALWRSRAVPRGAVLLIPSFIIVDGFLSRGLEGHAISFAAACWIASAVLLAGRPVPVR